MCMPPTARASSLHSPCSPHCSLPQLGVEAPFRDLVVFVEQGTKDGSTLLLPSTSEYLPASQAVQAVSLLAAGTEE